MRRIQPPDENDDLGYPAPNERMPPVSKRWNIRYAASLAAFYDRAKRLLPLWITESGHSDGTGDVAHD
jgi:hypothetical protein